MEADGGDPWSEDLVLLEVRRLVHRRPAAQRQLIVVARRAVKRDPHGLDANEVEGLAEFLGRETGWVQRCCLTVESPTFCQRLSHAGVAENVLAPGLGTP